LIGYITATHQTPVPTVTSLREFLRQKLPDYMVPATFVTLEKLPLTNSGKIHRKALPEPPSITHNGANPEAIPRNAVERQVLRIWEDIIGARGIGITDDFFAVGGHSLLAVRLIAELNKCFGIPLPLATIFHSPTVEGVAHTIQNSEQLKTKPPGLIAPRVNEASRAIFWAPSVGALERFVECHNLARLLRGQYDFYGFDPAPEFTDIGSLAEHCIRVIRAEQPHGPYSLAGYCQCGHVAYEIAQRLETEGEKIELLAIIDCSARELAPTLRQKLYWLRDGFRGEPRTVARRLNSALRRRVFASYGCAPAGNGHRENPFWLHGTAARRHRAGRFGGTLTLFRAEESSLKFAHTPTLGWNALATTVQVHAVPCRHSEMLKDPSSIELIAESLRNSLDRHN